ncbi:MFS transporter [Nocardioides jensenii]|uniref:MFS transporter n=1 Tax=Nocardioides jensenii TaxID=1843 RepID=UPI000833504D|nr:MFS transporter [Nocardioides jensenii]
MGESARPGAVAAVLVAAAAVASLVYSLAMPLLGEFPAIFGISASSATWIIVANSVSGAVSTPVTGRLGDTWGARRTLLGSMACLVVGSVVCTVATSLEVMLVGRVLQGVAAGTVPLAIGIVRHVVPARNLGAVIGALSATLGLGSGVGITMAGLLLAHGSWRLVFAATSLLAVVVFVLVAKLVPADAPATTRQIDVWGAVGLGIVLTCLLVPLSKGSEWGWGSALVWSMAGVAVVVGAAWVVHQLRHRQPMVNVRLALSARFGGVLVLSLVVGGTIFFSLLTVVVVVQAPHGTDYGLGRTALASGLVLIPGNLMMLVAPVPTARFAREFGVRAVLRVGLAIVAAGYLLRAGLDRNLLEVSLGYLFVQSGVGVCLAALPLAVARSSPAAETSSAQALSTTMRQTGIAIAGAGYAALVAVMHLDFEGHLFPTSRALDVSFLAGVAIALVGIVGTYVGVRRVH